MFWNLSIKTPNIRAIFSFRWQISEGEPTFDNLKEKNLYFHSNCYMLVFFLFLWILVPLQLWKLVEFKCTSQVLSNQSVKFLNSYLTIGSLEIKCKWLQAFWWSVAIWKRREETQRYKFQKHFSAGLDCCRIKDVLNLIATVSLSYSSDRNLSKTSAPLSFYKYLNSW